MRVLYLLLIVATASTSLSAGLKNLTLKRALRILERSNLEIKASKYEQVIKYYEHVKAKSKKYGTIDLTYTAVRSNDAGNVFGFKVQSREATFADFGFADFMGALGTGIMLSAQQNNGVPSFPLFAQGLSENGGSILAIQPADLNYPAPRSHFSTKITYNFHSIQVIC